MNDTGGNEVFKANVLLPEAWVLQDKQVCIMVDASHNVRDADGHIVVGEEALFELSGDRQELK
jgi:hypothetical protein